MTEQEISQGEVTLEMAKAMFEEKIKRAVEDAKRRGVPEEAEPAGWWNLWAWGPWQPVSPGGPLRPHKVIKLGEPAYIFTILWLNPWLVLDGGPTVCDLISNLACQFEVKYCTGNKCTWSLGPDSVNVKHSVKMVPDRCWDYDVLRFVPRVSQQDPGWEGENCFETHICARITGCEETKGAPPLAGFATQVFDFDADLFVPIPTRPRWEVDTPIQFMVYP